MATNKSTNLKRTEEIQDIIEKMPTNTGRIIHFIIIGFTCLLGLFSWLIEYPELIKAPITVSANQSPIKLVSKSCGRLKLLKKKTNATIKQGEYIAYIETSADFKDICFVDSILKNYKPNDADNETTRDNFPRKVNIGELTESYFRFLNALELKMQFPATQNYFYQKKDNKLQLKVQLDLYTQLKKLEKLKEKSRTISENLLKKDSLQFYEIKGMAETDLEKSKLDYNSALENSMDIDREINTCKNQIDILENKCKQLGLDEQSYKQKLNIDFSTYYNDLMYGIRQWLLTYTFAAPINGRLEFLDFFKNNAYIENGEDLFSIIPEKSIIYGNVYLPISGAGKVSPGQLVNIKLENFPYTEYGIIKGKVKSISMLAEKKINISENETSPAYLVTIDLPRGLITNYNTQLKFNHDTKGVAEIVTSKRRLIERFFDNLKYITKND